MGKQFRFVMDEKDEHAFFDFIKQNNCFYTDDEVSGPVEIKDLPLNSWFKLYIYNEQFGNLVFLKYGDEKYMIDGICAPVIEFCHTFVRDTDQEIKRGRLWLEMKFWNAKEILIQKDSHLDDLYKQCVNWIKKHLECVVLQCNEKKTKEYVSKSLVQKVLSGYHLLG